MSKDEQYNEFGLLLNLSEIYVKNVRDKVVKSLRKMNDQSMLLSGEDSGLKNVWDEICVQAQHDYSYYWDEHVQIIDGFILDEIKRLEPPILELLQYVGSISLEIDWREMGYDCAIQEIRDYVLLEAEAFRNRRIDRYLDKMDEFE